MAIAADYVLNAYSFMKSSPLDALLNVGYQSKEGNPIPSFDENVLIELCSEARVIFEKEPNILELEGDFIVVGDIHGSFHDLLRIIHYIEKVQLKVIFLGDYVDRGEFSLECITLLFAIKAKYPDFFYLLRGNHEFDSICSQYGFKNEIIDYHNPKKIKQPKTPIIDEKYKLEIMNYDFDQQKSEKNDDDTHDNKYDEYYANHNDMNCYKYSEKLYEAFIQAFSYLPIGAILNGTTLCIHGGLSPRFEVLDHLRMGITRPINNFEDNSILSDLVWSDPSSSFSVQFDKNPRGKGYLFNSDSVKNFLNANNLTRIIRAHQCVKHGSLTQFNEKCITVFSASSYGPDMENESGILKLFKNSDKVRFVTFPPIPRLKKSDAIYFKVEQFSCPDENNSDKHHTCFSIRHPTLAASNHLRPITCQTKKQVKSPQTPHIFTQQRFSKPVFVTSSRKTNPAIRKPLTHSISIEGLARERKGSISGARSFQHYDENNNEKPKSLFTTQSLLCIDETGNRNFNSFNSISLHRVHSDNNDVMGNLTKSTGNLLGLNENEEETYRSLNSESLLCPNDNENY